VFPLEQVLDSLYKDIFLKERAIYFADSKDIILQSGFINLVRIHLISFFKQLTHSPLSAVDIYRGNLNQLKDH
jgi:hypothetical protein